MILIINSSDEVAGSVKSLATALNTNRTSSTD